MPILLATSEHESGKDLHVAPAASAPDLHPTSFVSVVNLRKAGYSCVDVTPPNPPPPTDLLLAALIRKSCWRRIFSDSFVCLARRQVNLNLGSP